MMASPPARRRSSAPGQSSVSTHGRLEGGRHGGADRLAVERIAAARSEHDGLRAERRGVAEEAADVVGVVHALGDHHQVERRPRQGLESARQRTRRQRQTTAMDVEADHAVHHRLRHHEHRRRRIQNGERRGHGRGRRLGEQQRVEQVASSAHQPIDHQAPFGHEQPAGDQRLWGGDVAVSLEPRIVEVGRNHQRRGHGMTGGRQRMMAKPAVLIAEVSPRRAVKRSTYSPRARDRSGRST